MAENAEQPDDAEAAAPAVGDGEGEEEGGKKGGGKMILFIALPVVILVLAGAAAFLFLGGGDKAKAAQSEEAAYAEGEGGEKEGKAGEGEKKDKEGDGEYADQSAKAAAAEVVFYQLPDILVNVRSESGRPSYLKLKVTLEVESAETASAIEPAMPRVMDRFQAFLRELRIEDLSGSAGTYRLRAELLRRINLAVAPIEVRAVLIEEMLIQ